MATFSGDPAPETIPIDTIYGDVENARKLFLWFLALTSVGMTAGLAINLLAGNTVSVLWITAVFPLIAVTLSLVLRRKIELAAALLAIFMMTLFTAVSSNGMRLHDVNNLAFPIILITANLVINRRMMVFVAGFSIACISWLAYSEYITSNITGIQIVWDFLSTLLIIILTALMVRLLTEAFLKNNQRLRKELIERRLAEEKYRAIFENSLDGIFQSTPDGRFINVNPTMARLYGYGSPEEMIANVSNISSDIYVDPDVRSILRERLAREEKITGFESLDYRKDGSTFWSSMNIQAIRSEKGNILYYEGTVEDVTARKQMELENLQAQQALAKNQQRLQVFFDQSLDGFFFMMFDTPIQWDDTVDKEASLLRVFFSQTYTDVNNAMLAQYGLTREEFLKKTSSDFFSHDPGQGLHLRRELFNNSRLHLETNERKADGSPVWFEGDYVCMYDDEKRITGFFGIQRDITERKKAEQALRESETKFRMLAENIPNVIYQCKDDEYYTFIYINEYVEKLTGYTQQDFLEKGMSFFEIYHPDDIPMIRNLSDNVTGQKSAFHITYRIRHKSGEWRWLNEWGAYIESAQGEVDNIVGMISDITEKKKAEEELQRSEERFRKVFHASPIAISLTTLEEGRLLDANDAYWDITGYHPSDIGKNAAELHLWDIPAEREDFLKELRSKHSLSNLDDYFYHTDGTYKQVTSFYELIYIENMECILAMFYDMSTQKRLERERETLIRELEVRNAESETLRESFASIVGTFDFEEIVQKILDQIRRVIPYDSASVWKVEGDTQKFVAGRNLPPEMYEGKIEFTADESNSALPLIEGKVPYILNNNVQEELGDFQSGIHTYVNSWLAIPLKTRGNIIGLIALDGKRKGQFSSHHAELAVSFANQVAIALENSRLFTEAQHELILRENLIRELESKNAELERFTYTVSHDLKSPLVTISGFLGYLEQDASEGNASRLRNDVNRIREAVNRMHRLLSELLELSRIGRLINPPENIPFNDLVREVLEIVDGQLKARNVTVRTQPDLPTVHGDRQRLTEVLQNLLDNAAKFMGEQASPLIEIGLHGTEKGNPIFFVRDNGIGIENTYHDKIFGLFNKLDLNSEGTGIGLALVRRIIEVHGCRIWVESEAGRGSTFYFTLPAPK